MTASLQLAFFNSDRINRQGTCIPCSALAASIENAWQDSLGAEFPHGMPVHYAHDMHRLIGWSCSLGILFSGDLVLQVGHIATCSDDTQAPVALREAQSAYFQYRSKEDRKALILKLQAALPANELSTGLPEVNPFGLAYKEGIAARLYPDLFDEDSPLVDKDGLTTYSELSTRFEQRFPGVFCDKGTGLLLFAHPYFRRSLSRLNSLNEYFLSELNHFASCNPSQKVRLRLDPDAVSHVDAELSRLELEHWHGPQFEENITAIKSGVAVHKMTGRAAVIEGIDETHFWWKEPEVRSIDGNSQQTRTLEIEELTSLPSFGLGEDTYGCRYVHGEYEERKNTFIHFDGAIRAYSTEAFLERQEAQINRAGKHSQYTKLFRTDGDISVKNWKSLVNAFYRGNTLILEYLAGRSQSSGNREAAHASIKEFVEDPFAPQLLVSYSEADEFVAKSHLDLACQVPYEGHNLYCVEVKKDSALSEYCLEALGAGPVALCWVDDRVLDLPRFVMGSGTSKHDLEKHLSLLQVAALRDAQRGSLDHVALSVAWPWQRLLVTVAVSGRPNDVATLLHGLAQTADPKKPPSAWALTLKEKVRAISSSARAHEHASSQIQTDGTLRVRRFDDSTSSSKSCKAFLPDSLAASLSTLPTGADINTSYIDWRPS